MEQADPHLQDTVDAVLEAAWPKERRRAGARMAASALGRIAVFVCALLVLAVAVHLVFGVVVPGTFFVFMTVLALVCARPEAAERAQLDQKGSGRSGRAGPPHRPSTGCYPRTEWE